jgi:hypothetical protein
MKTYPPGGSTDASAPIFLTCLKAKLFFSSLVCSTSTQPTTPKHRSLLRRAQEHLRNVLLLQNSPISPLHHHIPSSGVTIYILIPCNRVSKMMKTPYFKFISHLSQFLIFLCLIAASALRDTHAPTVLGKNIA